MTDFRTDKSYAQALDAADPLRGFRDRFHIPHTKDGAESIYLCGNSLGLQPKATKDALLQELQDWQDLGVEGHFHARNPWLPYHEFLTESYARLVGASPLEVVAMNTLSVNLHLMMVSFYRPTTQRYKIIIEAHAFPSDRYAVQSQLLYHGFKPETDMIELKPRDGEVLLRTEDIESVIKEHGDSIALILLGGVNYYTGQVFDMERITQAGHAVGAVVGFDLAHAAGNIPLRLHDWGVDFACWCSYKYLNSGPGSVAGCFVHEKHAHNSDLPRFCGWWGHDKAIRFKMGPDFKAIPGAEGWQLSNPPILSLAAVKASLALFDEAGMDVLRAKSEKMTGYLEFLLQSLQSNKFAIMTPSDPAARG
ncbi:MAG: kynureninase, partial [Alphaproteobacteria bacterium]|nr:kynureninase [Alphaproteobacteria bacterium]